MTGREKRVCLITGGARGIGAASARLATQRGYAVCVSYLSSQSEAEALVASLRPTGAEAIAVRADVSREDDVQALFAAIDGRLGPITALVNNAGISDKRQPINDTEFASFNRVVGVNLGGAFLCIKAAVARMAKSKGGLGGAIVNLSSTVTQTGGYRLSSYVAAKAGIEGLTLALAPELASEGIRINALRPGFIATESQPLDDKEWRKRALASIPLGRLGAPEEVGHAVLWLLSDEASYITGAVLPVAGGR